MSAIPTPDEKAAQFCVFARANPRLVNNQAVKAVLRKYEQSAPIPKDCSYPSEWLDSLECRRKAQGEVLDWLTSPERHTPVGSKSANQITMTDHSPQVTQKSIQPDSAAECPSLIG
ncbi:hypothetical protein Tdes44962_MAKER09021 [Teratosphaeria destructans]|uniref:Uncharacterized protein n=1 Tax=Teratosphaeria destructans TaxID=418781 RepID=A0A9W7SU93_9PEZI|nr:hypothetical protein Tdes44962_MAKER09021 [Teratosphaeria destructans]